MTLLLLEDLGWSLIDNLRGIIGYYIWLVVQSIRVN